MSTQQPEKTAQVRADLRSVLIYHIARSGDFGTIADYIPGYFSGNTPVMEVLPADIESVLKSLLDEGIILARQKQIGTAGLGTVFVINPDVTKIAFTA